MSFAYTGFPKRWFFFSWYWAEPDKACASKCCQHLQDLGNPQPISSLITVLILREPLCLIIRVSTHTSQCWLWSHLLCSRTVHVEAAPGQQPCRAPAQAGKAAPDPQAAQEASFTVLCAHSSPFLAGLVESILLISMLWSQGSIFSLFLRGGRCQHSLSPGLPSGADSQFPSVLLSRIVL